MKKGFTLIELLATITLIGIIGFLIIPNVIEMIEENKQKIYDENNKKVLEAVDSYLVANSGVIPLNNGDTVEITMEDLKAYGSLETVVSPKNNAVCDGYVTVTKTEDKYETISHISCDDNINITNATANKLFYHYPFEDFAEPTTNLIPNGSINAYPQVGNTHGTYNTNQYNSNTFFSIGTIGSISNNEVNLSVVDHEIYTYDVLRPETTGGGVTAGVNYFIKKLDADTFTLHEYDSTPDGSKGFGVHDSIKYDERININATGFPTMWHGAAHRPNSALVKEIIPNCFTTLDGKKHECIRMHTEHKPDGPVDGMAYGVLPVVTAGETYTFSFYYRALTEETIGNTIRLDLYTSGGWPGDNVAETITNINQWQRYELTVVAPNSGGTNLYFWLSKDGTLDISEIQVEHKDHVTDFVVGTRDDSIIDYSINSNDITLTETVTPAWYEENNNGYYNFDGVDDYFKTPNPNLTSNVFTYSMWMKPDAVFDSNSMIVCPDSAGRDQYIRYYPSLEAIYLTIAETNDTNQRTWNTGIGTVPKDTWTNVVLTINDTIVKVYVNGEKKFETEETIPIALWDETWNIGQRGTSGYYYKGGIDDIRLYKRVLSETEVEYLYKSTKSIYE